MVNLLPMLGIAAVLLAWYSITLLIYLWALNFKISHFNINRDKRKNIVLELYRYLRFGKHKWHS